MLQHTGSRLVVCWGGAVLVLCSIAARVRERPVESHGRGMTILSGSTTDPATADRALRFLAEVRRALPSGASVAFVWSGHRTQRDDENTFMTAIGQLPDQDVWPASSLLASSSPEFLIAFDGTLADGRYALAKAMRDGVLYRHVR